MNIIKLYRYLKHKQMLKKLNANLKISDRTVLLDSINFDVRTKREDLIVKIGEESMIGCNFIFESGKGRVEIGKRCYIGGGTNLIAHSDITIGNDVTMAWGIWVYTHDSHSLDWKERVKDIARQNDDYRAGRNFIVSKDWSVVNTAPIRICDKAWIGMNVIILKGVTIGEGAIVGAGSVVTHDVPAWSVVAGNPARVVKMLK